MSNSDDHDATSDTESPQESSFLQRVFYFPQNLLPDKSEVCHVAVTLRHPKDGTPALFLRPEDGECYYELVKFSEKPRSWFIGDTVESCGELYIVTAMDSVYFSLFYLQKSEKFRPLDDIFDDQEFSHAHNLRTWCEKRINRVADTKEISGGSLRVFRMNQEKTVDWLSRRVRRVADVLEARRLCSTSSADFVRSSKDAPKVDPIEYTQQAFFIVRDYVSESLASKLKTALGLDNISEKKPSPHAEEMPSKKKKGDSVKPSEDYTNGNGTPKESAPKGTKAAPKKEKKVNMTGMRTISSFFTKK
ncbi:ribonuclease H2 subunit B-like [Ornithodoros turicata]|uniref:ribonuclease H2 subunit B-like n=1 Tax=Ornithodoros turicata TaxID=34597 RepID=UPI003139EFC9